MTKTYPNAKAYLDALASQGRYTFSTDEFAESAASSRASAYNALARLMQHEQIASPAKGFYVIVPPEYRTLGCLPAEQFIPALLERNSEPYYAGLLTAAQYYGAAHQRPQAFQVVIAQSRKDIHCGNVKVSFIANKQVADVPTRPFNTPRGVLKVSTPEATALDLVAYSDRAGGLDMVATVLSDLADEIDSSELERLSRTVPITRVQRLGFLLDHVDHPRVSDMLQPIVKREARDYTSLAPDRTSHQSTKNKRWKVYVNASVEVDE